MTYSFDLDSDPDFDLDYPTAAMMRFESDMFMPFSTGGRSPGNQKKPAVACRFVLASAGRPFGGLERIDLYFTVIVAGLYMRGEIARPAGPLGFRLGKTCAVFFPVKLLNPLASFAVFHNRITATADIGAALFTHEIAFHTLSDGIALHKNSPLN
jgi:hypothetical protein